MSPKPSVAANLSPKARQKVGIGMVAKSKPVSQLAAEHQVSRKFVYQQGQKAKAAVLPSIEPCPKIAKNQHQTSVIFILLSTR